MWDCDERSYSYFIEVSNNEKDWEVVWDRSKVPCRSWQTITFPRRAIVYIRIVGTYNTANEVFHCVHFECPAVSTCTKSLGNSEQVDEEREANEATSSEGEEASSTSENQQDDDSTFKRPKQRYVQSAPDNGISSIQYQNRAPPAVLNPERRTLNEVRNNDRPDSNRSGNRGKKREKRTTHRQNYTQHAPHPSNSSRKHIQSQINIAQPPIVAAGISPDIASSRASVVTVATALDDVASTVANAAEQEEEQQQIIQATEDEAFDTESVANVDGDLVDVNDATETQSQISHHSSPASYAGSISGHSTAGVNANNSLPVGASACSMARQCQQEQFGYKTVPQGLNQHPNSNTTTFNLRILSQQPPISDTSSTTNIQTAHPSRHTHHQSPQGSGSPVSSPSSPAPIEQQLLRQSNVSF